MFVKKPIMCSTWTLQKFMFPSVLFLRNNPSVRLIDNGPLSSLYAFLLQAIDGVIYLALCPYVVSQAPQHSSSMKQDTCDDCFSCQSICSVIYLRSGMPREVHKQEFSKVDVGVQELCGRKSR